MLQDKDKLNEQATTQEEQKAIEKKAFELLQRREHSRLELKQKLLARHFQAQLIDTQLEQLIEQGWLSDARFAQSYTRHCISRNLGPMRIRAELQARGIQEDLYREALAEQMDEMQVDWYAMALATLKKRYCAEDIHDRKQELKCQRFLAYRGFTPDQARYAIEMLKS